MTYRIESGIALPARYPDSNRTCSFCGSADHYYAKQLCKNCYSRNIKRGSPRYIFGEPAMSTYDKLHFRIKPSGECLIWEGRYSRGIPYFHRCNVRRLLWEKQHVEQPKHTRFIPTCGNDRCVSPSHMRVQAPLSEQEVAASMARTQGLTKSDAAKVMWSDGLSKQQIGTALGVTRERARQLVDRPGPFKRKQMEERTAKIAELLGQRLTLTDIRQQLDLSYGEITFAIKNHLNGEYKVDYVQNLKARRDELQSKVDEFAPVVEELKRVKSAIAVFEPRSRPTPEKGTKAE